MQRSSIGDVMNPFALRPPNSWREFVYQSLAGLLLVVVAVVVMSLVFDRDVPWVFFAVIFPFMLITQMVMLTVRLRRQH